MRVNRPWRYKTLWSTTRVAYPLQYSGISDCHHTLLQRLAQDLEAMSFELGEFIGEEDAMVGQRHLARHGHLAAADQPHI
jgi:hypothetical protein